MKAKSFLSLLCAVLILFSFAGCGGHASHYQAVACVHSNTGNTASLSFYEFKGTMVFKLKLKDKSEGDIKYTAELEEGNVTVSYEYNGIGSELFELSSGEKLDDRGGYIEKGTVYVIIKTDGKCKNGRFEFSV